MTESSAGYVGVSTSEMRTLGSYWVKGSSINSKLAFARETYGEAAEAALEAFLTERGAPQVLEASWYPFKLYDDTLRFLATQHFGGDLKRLSAVGRYSAQQSLTGTYSVFVRPGGFRAFLERSASFHSRYYSAGTLKLEEASADGKFFRMSQSGAPIYTQPDMELAVGFYCQAAEMMGLTGVRCTYDYTDAGVEFVLQAS